MQGETLVDEILEDALEVSASDSTNAPQRTRALRAIQAALQIIWIADQWDFRFVNAGTTTLAAGAYSSVSPSGFEQVSSDGQVWLQNDSELTRADATWVNRIRRQRFGSRAKPEHYAVKGQDSTTKRPLIIFDAVSDAAYTVELDYEKVCPTITDADTASGLDAFPDEHCQSVLKPAVIELLLSGSGDGRVISELGPRGKAALASMKSHRNQQQPDDSRLGDLGLGLHRMH